MIVTSSSLLYNTTCIIRHYVLTYEGSSYVAAVFAMFEEHLC